MRFQVLTTLSLCVSCSLAVTTVEVPRPVMRLALDKSLPEQLRQDLFLNIRPLEEEGSGSTLKKAPPGGVRSPGSALPVPLLHPNIPPPVSENFLNIMAERQRAAALQWAEHVKKYRGWDIQAKDKEVIISYKPPGAGNRRGKWARS